MTDDTHPISDAELDAVLGHACVQLDKTLDRAMNVDFGTEIRLVNRLAEKKRQRDVIGVLSRNSSTPSHEALHMAAVNRLIEAIVAAIDEFPDDDNFETASRLDDVAEVAIKLGDELYGRAISRQQARRVLDEAITSVENLAQENGDSSGFSAFYRGDMLKKYLFQLKKYLFQLKDAVERLFDDAEDWSAASTQLH